MQEASTRNFDITSRGLLSERFHVARGFYNLLPQEASSTTSFGKRPSQQPLAQIWANCNLFRKLEGQGVVRTSLFAEGPATIALASCGYSTITR